MEIDWKKQFYALWLYVRAREMGIALSKHEYQYWQDKVNEWEKEKVEKKEKQIF